MGMMFFRGAGWLFLFALCAALIMTALGVNLSR
jgi:hypothetical protein